LCAVCRRRRRGQGMTMATARERATGPCGSPRFARRNRELAPWRLRVSKLSFYPGLTRTGVDGRGGATMRRSGRGAGFFDAQERTVGSVRRNDAGKLMATSSAVNLEKRKLGQSGAAGPRRASGPSHSTHSSGGRLCWVWRWSDGLRSRPRRGRPDVPEDEQENWSAMAGVSACEEAGGRET